MNEHGSLPSPPDGPEDMMARHEATRAADSTGSHSQTRKWREVWNQTYRAAIHRRYKESYDEFANKPEGARLFSLASKRASSIRRIQANQDRKLTSHDLEMIYWRETVLEYRRLLDSQQNGGPKKIEALTWDLLYNIGERAGLSTAEMERLSAAWSLVRHEQRKKGWNDAMTEVATALKALRQ